MTTIEELERRCAAGESIIAIAQSTGVTKQCVSARLIRSREAKRAALELSDLKRGDILREKETGHHWQYLWPSERPGCARVVTTGGAASMDMSITRLEKATEPQIQAPEGYFYPPVTVFSVARGDDPHDPKFQPLISHVMEVRDRLDQEKQEAKKADPDANLRATVAKKAESRRKIG